MPPLKFVEVVTYSSEDSNHPAKNLLKLDTYLKWKSEAGRKENQEYVVLKLEQLSSIHSIDIGNENSAFIEVLVSRDGTDFKILLVASAFMSPLEARNGSSSNRVRMFAYDKLNENIATQKWDRIKVICTQPFIKMAQYGLTFIKVYGPENNENSAGETKLGKFNIREEDDDDTLSVGSFFSKRGESFSSFSSEDGNQNLKRSHEDASSSNAPSSAFYQLKKKIKESSEKRDNSPTPKPSKLENEKDGKPTIKENKKAEKPIVKENKKIEKPTNRLTENKNRDDKPSARPTSRNNHSSATKAALPTPAAAKVKMKRKSRPFKKLMNDVVFVMSGYQNPKRSQLRDALLDMGAKYKADWGPGCTHLICAFKNTPKFQQVKGKGKIVNEKWVEDSMKKKIRLPWRRYNLEKNEKDESEEEIWASEICSSPENGNVPESQREQLSDTDEMADSEDTDDELQRAMQNNGKKDKSQDVPKEKVANNSKKPAPTNQRPAPTDQRSASTDQRPAPTNQRPAPTNQRPAPSNQRPAPTDQRPTPTDQRPTPNDPSSDGEYDANTDVDEDIDVVERKDTTNIPLSPLKNFFRGKKMYFFGSYIDEAKRKTLERYIIAFQGTVSNYMSEDVNFVITDDCWDENFDNALEDNPSLQFVKSQWIWKCCNAEKMVPSQPHLVVPKEAS